MVDGNERKRKPGRKISPIENISHVTMHLDEANRTLKVADTPGVLLPQGKGLESPPFPLQPLPSFESGS